MQRGQSELRLLTKRFAGRDFALHNVYALPCVSLHSAAIVIEIQILRKPLDEQELRCEQHCNYLIIVFPS